MKSIVLFLLLMMQLCTIAQETTISFVPFFQEKEVMLNQDFYTKDDTIRFENIKIYLSKIQLYNDDKLIFTVVKKHHLINLENPKTQQLVFPITKNIQFNSIHFSIGIDSITNVSGVFGEDLDPTNGMYWTWQSGYINFKIEGYSKKCPARKQFFQYHIGGYQEPFYPIQHVELPIKNHKKTVIEIQLEEIFKELDITKLYEIMSPSNSSVEFAKLFSTLFQEKE